MAETPELDKQLAVIKSGRSEAVQDFIDWLPTAGYSIQRVCTEEVHGQIPEGHCYVCSGTRMTGPVGDLEQLMADHFGIDRDKIETERRALLEELREANA